MASKGERTRAEVISRTAALLNREGFLAAPMSAIVQATGLQKGGLYRHFESREALAFEAFDHAVAQVRERFMRALQGKTDACAQLLALLDAHGTQGEAAHDIPFAGGCPIMNSAIESDHAHPAMRRRAQAAMSGWHGLLRQIVERGQRTGQIRAGTLPAEVASVFIACLEGAVMLTHLYGDASHLAVARRHLANYVARELRPDKKEPA